ncbi:MAG: hypothetical protein QNJ88_02620 [Acidimicrobiia bacterium]|nr:hypothetical protein [Acidimicrobiia bacterium]
MPGGSDYPGPPASLEQYTTVVEASNADAVVKGAKNPYTSRNGHMFSFLDREGAMALRLSDELRDEFLEDHESEPVMQYNSVMRGYVWIPAELFTDTAAAGDWFAKSYDWIGTLPPKATKK